MEKTYDEFIAEILNTRGRFNCGDEYHERHHIIPKCVGGTNDKDNLIDLYAREHFEAHKLLAQENPDNDSLTYAWACMAWLKGNGQHRDMITPEEYEEVRKKHSEVCSKRYAGENNPMYGISPRERMDEDTYMLWLQHVRESMPLSKEKRSQANLGKKYSDEVNAKKGRKGVDSYMYGKHLSEETKQKLREANLGKRYFDEVNAKKGKSGVENPFYGKHHSEEAKIKMSNARKGKPSKIIGENNPNARKVNQYDENGNFIKTWEYMKQPSKELGISYTGIYACCNDRQKTAGGFIWRYFDEEEQDYAKNIII